MGVYSRWFRFGAARGGLREARDAVMALRAARSTVSGPSPRNDGAGDRDRLEAGALTGRSAPAVRRDKRRWALSKLCKLSPAATALIETFSPRTAPIPLDSRCASKRSRYGSQARVQSRRQFLQAGGVKVGRTRADVDAAEAAECVRRGRMIDWAAPTGGYLLQGHNRHARRRCGSAGGEGA